MHGKSLVSLSGVYKFYRADEEYFVQAEDPEQAVEALLSVYFPNKDLEHHIVMNGRLQLTGVLYLVSKEKQTYGWRRDFKVKREYEN